MDGPRARHLRILQVSPYFQDAWSYGGIPRVVTALTSELARRGSQVTVCTTDAGDRARRLPCATGRRFQPWRAPSSAPGIDLRVFPNLSNLLAYDLQFFVPLGLRAFLHDEVRSFDIAHLHGCHNLPGAIAARELARAGVPYVISPHGTGPRIERRRLAKYLFDHTLGRDVERGAARILAVTEAERRQLLSMGMADASIQVIPDPLDLSEFDAPPVRGAFRRRAGLSDDEPLVLYLGKLTPRKGVDVLLRALPLLRTTAARLVIAGNDMGTGRALRALAARLGLGARVTFAGLLRGRERIEALADAHVVAYPSEHEVLGLVPLEALLCGTPVVVADDSGCGEVIGQVGGGRLVRYGDAAALAAALDEILAAPGRWRAAAGAAQPRVRSRYAASAVCAQIEDAYRAVLQPHVPLPPPRPAAARAHAVEAR